MTRLDRLRQTLRQQRRELSLAEQKEHGLQAVVELQASKLVPPRTRVAAFLAQDGELDTQALISHLWAQACQVFLPIIDFETKRLIFSLYQPETGLIKNRYGIEEPQTTRATDLIAPTQLDFVFMPLVGFDAKGRRLGMGGGFYDKTFEFKLKKPKLHPTKTSPSLIGWAHACQQVNALSPQAWDVPLDAIITEQACLRFVER
ncbi:5-formyltetrahydrofolate cyclo-ligase [Thiomicrospira sp. R3]|uniref:5-formyltetrahydrofolate cyclo-ligase n=1 Tax=Thiomicrospira sp. R3 TaxID=3035472 RepID=UPI00259B9FB5|nr:5-formyltetrahydrofolate cyclo-ligase [Thiomicrospira sp. R3]WFE68661.1 5-formyltetrahydrofolate cyclo-ligase [Thiomicrospira sp. R3]